MTDEYWYVTSGDVELVYPHLRLWLYTANGSYHDAFAWNVPNRRFADSSFQSPCWDSRDFVDHVHAVNNLTEDGISETIS